MNAPRRTCAKCGREIQPGEPCPSCALEQVLFGIEEEESGHVRPSEAGAKTPEISGEDAGNPAGSEWESRPRDGSRGAREFNAIGREPVFDPTDLPCRFGVYEVRREIAAGGMGVVYEAIDTRIQRTVALKMIRCLALARPMDRARFKAEAEVVALLDHPGIVPIYDVGESAGQPYFTMKLMEGGNLAERQRRKAMTTAEVVRTLAQIARALDHAHARGVLHRDLKPGNILFDLEDQPHITDFGLAKVIGNDTGLTLSKDMIGTPQYMPPEQAQGRVKDICAASDVWSLGVIFYELLVGHPPFSGDSAPEVLRRVTDFEPARPSAVSRRIDRDLETLCLRCLEKDPARRLPHAGDLADELERWLNGEPIRARPITPGERAAKWVRRNPVLATLSAALLMALVISAVATTLLWRRSEAARAVAERNAGAARSAEHLAADNAYYSGLTAAFSARERGDFGRARRQLNQLDASRRGFEWRLLNWFSKGDAFKTIRFEKAVPETVAWDDASHRFAILTDDRFLHFMDPSSGRVEKSVAVPVPTRDRPELNHEPGFHSLAFAPDGKHFACADNQYLLVVETATGKLLRREAYWRPTVAWLDNDRVLTAWRNGLQPPIKVTSFIYNTATGRDEPRPEGELGPVAVSPDRQWLVSDFIPQNFRVFRAPFKEPSFVVTNRGGNIKHLAIARDGRYVAVVRVDSSGADHNELEIHRANESDPFFVLPLPSVREIAFAPNEETIAVLTEDAAVRTFRFTQPTPPGAESTYDDRADGGAPVGPEGPVTLPANLLTRSAQKGRTGFLLGHEGPVRSLAFTQDGRALATVSRDGAFRQWPLVAEAPKSRRIDLASEFSWRHPMVSANGRWVGYVGLSGYIWDRQTHAQEELPANVEPAAMLSDGRLIVRNGATAEIYCTKEGQKIWSLIGAPSFRGYPQICHSAVSRDESTAALLIPGKLIVIDCLRTNTSGTPDQSMRLGASGVQSLDVSPDGAQVAVTGFLGNPVRIYAATNVLGGYFVLGEGAQRDTTPAFHPDGKRLFVGAEDGQVHVYDVALRRELTNETWRAETGFVTALAISLDGSIVAVAGRDAITFWDAAAAASGSRRERLRLPVSEARNWMRFAANDSLFLHSAPRHPLEVWEAPIEALSGAAAAQGF